MLAVQITSPETTSTEIQSVLTERNFTVDIVDMKVLASFDEAQEPGEPDFVVELIDLYLNEAPRRFEAIRVSVARADSSLLKQAAHALKGSSASLGIRQVAEICETLEHSDLNTPLNSSEALVQLLEHKFAKSRDLLLTERKRRLLESSNS